MASTAGVLPASAQQRTAQRVPGMSHLDDIWCGPDGVCLGVGIAPGPVGAVVVLRANGQTGPVRTVLGTHRLSGVDCPPGGGCVVVGTGASGGMVVEVSRDGTPGPARSAPGASGLFYVACPTATTCLATGALYVLPPNSAHGFTTPVFTVIANGQPAPAQDFPRGTRNAFGIDCPTTTTCLAVATSAIVVLRDVGGSWLATLRRIPVDSDAGHPMQDISCASSTTCHATASGFVQTPEGYYGIPGMMAVTADGVPGPVQVLSEQRGISNGISCVFGRTCTVVGQKHNGPNAPEGLSIDVFRGSPGPLVVWPEVGHFGAVSCIAPATCGIIGYNAVFAWHGPVPA
ncbi:MAG TPA: hypothetical protein VHF00_04260 [Acidimicrobiales bacterium]|nr:hypothetical protein [Acidimicrobiales bacterium]